MSGNFIVLPFALAFGRRPAFLVAAVVLLFSTIGAATQNSYGGHLAARLFQGLSSGATESVSKKIKIGSTILIITTSFYLLC